MKLSRLSSNSLLYSYIGSWIIPGLTEGSSFTLLCKIDRLCHTKSMKDIRFFFFVFSHIFN